MSLPKWLNKSNKEKSIKQEKELAKDLGAKTTPASGATPFRKGDMRLNGYLIESKATANKSISIKLEWLLKIEKEALNEDKTPLIILEIDGNRYFIFRERDVDLNGE